MSTTQKLGIPLFESNENVTRDNFNSRLEDIDEVAASRQEIETFSNELMSHKAENVSYHVRTATVVVAASNSKYKQFADYVCTGTNDHNTISAAYNALPLGGGVIQLLDGLYNFNGGIRFRDGKNVYIRGTGMHTTIIKADPFFNQYEGAFRWYTAKGGVADLCIDANGEDISDWGIARFEDRGIIKDVLFKNCQSVRQALYINAQHVKVCNCIFQNNNSALGLATTSAHNIILGNTFIGNSTHINDLGTGNIIENNYIEEVV